MPTLDRDPRPDPDPEFLRRLAPPPRWIEGVAEYAAGLGLAAGDAARRRELWAHLWDAVNGKRDGGEWSWDKDPWTWAISFRRLEDIR